MNSSTHTRAIQAPPLPYPIRTIGQDFTEPFTIFVDGVEYADFPSLASADAVYATLRAKMRPTACEVQ